jgi:predicted DnaQ family exonuclease/DinG family helicase
LDHLELNPFSALYIPTYENNKESVRLEWCRCADLELAEPFVEEISFKDEMPVSKPMENERRGFPLAVWSSEDLQSPSPGGVLTNLADNHFEIWDVSALSKTFFPTLSDFSFTSVRNYLSGPDWESLSDAQALARMFLQILGHAGRMDLKDLSFLTRMTEHSHAPLKRLFRSVSKYMKDGPKVSFPFPPLVPPRLPAHIIGHSYGRVDSNSIEAIPDKVMHDVFQRGGFLNAQLENYEERPEQTKLAGAITAAFNQQQFILAEAGTGTGKSLAYLVPALYWTAQNHAFGESVVISTHTKNLQDQLFFKDIPLLEKILPISFRAVLLKGRANYLCMNKWKNIIMDPSAHLTAPEREKLIPVFLWLKETTTGDISECNGFPLDQNTSLWNKLASESAFCQAHKCNASDECFVKKIRDEARRAHVVIVNHALLFSDLISENAVLGEYHNLILDEAHHIEKTAQNYLGVEFSMWTARSFVSGLYERDQMETGTLILLRQKIASAALLPLEKTHAEKSIRAATDACLQFWIVVQNFFRSLTVALMKEKEFDMNEPIANGKSFGSKSHPSKIKYNKSLRPMHKAETAMNDFFDSAAELKTVLTQMLEIMRNWKTEVFPDSDELRQLLAARVEELHHMTGTVQFLADAENDDYVYWYELPNKERSMDTRFYGVPLNIAEILNTRLYEKLNTCVFSSATLSVAGNFNYYKSRVGLDHHDRLEQFSVGSSFDFHRQCRVGVASFLPDPSHGSFNSACAEIIKSMIIRHRKGMLVLFTSYSMMTACYREVKRSCDDVTLLLQGQDGSRTSLARQFLKDKNSVLFGTDSFWEGVDIPGASLEILIIAKLPFAVPSDPLVAAKMEQIDLRGGKSFLEYSVPEAVIKFRQGFGRLIRSKSDRGLALILDNRVLTKSYGKLFLDSLPVPSENLRSEHELMEAVEEFFT